MSTNMLGNSLEKRPGIFLVGSPNVGKHTLLSRLLSLDFEDVSDLPPEALVHGWTINTKYYTADVSIWIAHLHDQFSITALPALSRLAALVMVFDMSDLASLVALQDWVSQTEIHKYDILLCIGNKADLVSGHSAHVEYGRRLLRLSDSADPYVEFTKFRLSETEGHSLLGAEEPSWEIKKSCLEWCSERHIEYIETCASNADFDKRLSVDGDSQGVERIYSALSAHMWPGMVLKSGNKLIDRSFTDKQVLSEEESDYEIEYEVLSVGSAEPWDDTDEGWVSASGDVPIAPAGTPAIQTAATNECDHSDAISHDGEILEALTSVIPLNTATEIVVAPKKHGSAERDVPDGGACFEFEDLDLLMSEIGNMHNSTRLMPDFQRREMAAKLAMKMATMFGDSSGEEEGFD